MAASDLARRADWQIVTGENAHDLFYMIDLLAGWIKARNGSASDPTLLAGTILCPIFRNLKGPGYSKAAIDFRSRYKGVQRYAALAGYFLGRMKESILELSVPEDVRSRQFTEFVDTTGSTDGFFTA